MKRYFYLFILVNVQLVYTMLQVYVDELGTSSMYLFPNYYKKNSIDKKTFLKPVVRDL
jgi:hypothetical protein